MRSRNSMLIVLMITSVALLIILQALWLRGAYLAEAEDFRRETAQLFRSTIFSMHDSLIQKSIEPIPGDSTVRKKLKRYVTFDRSATDLPETGDTTVNYFKMEERTARIEIFASGDEDSLTRVIRPLINKLHEERTPSSFLVRINQDSLRIADIQNSFRSALQSAGIDVPFHVFHVKRERAERLPVGLPPFVRVRVDPRNEYGVKFSETGSLLLNKMLPQILFSAFLTLLTIGSFAVMYRSLRSQQKLNQLKNDFISNVTHELKTPVATVSVALEALKNFNALNDPQRTTEYIDIAQAELDRLTSMTDKILKTAVLDRHDLAFSTETVDVAELLEQAIASWKPVFEKKQITCEYGRQGENFQLTASREHLTNIFSNMIDNAIKYSGPDTGVAVSLQAAAGSITISFRDEGVGIDRQYHERIFEKFFRVPSGDVHTVKGYGLGLSYVSSVVHGYGGTISVDSAPGKGSCFTLVFPRK